MRLTFEQVESYATENGLWIERQGNKFIYGLGNGLEGEANSLSMAWDDIAGAIRDQNGG